MTPRQDPPRIRLRPVAAQDAAFLEQLVRSEVVRRYLGGPVADAAAHVRAVYLEGDEDAWIVEDAQSRAVGVVSLGVHRDGEGAEVSYQFDPDLWGQGYAEVGVEEVVRTAEARTILAETQAANAASCRLLERLGFVEHRRLQRFGAVQVIYIRRA